LREKISKKIKKNCRFTVRETDPAAEAARSYADNVNPPRIAYKTPINYTF
jgi:hypothetical protein